MEAELGILADVESRMKALAEVRRLRPEVAHVQAQVREAKGAATAAEPGSRVEQQHLEEALEASQRLAALQVELLRAEQEIRRTGYPISLLQE